MKTIEAKVPDAVLQQARELAERERIPLEQLISLAVPQTVGVWRRGLSAAAARSFCRRWTKCPTLIRRNAIGCPRGIGRKTDFNKSKMARGKEPPAVFLKEPATELAGQSSAKPESFDSYSLSWGRG